MSNQEATPVRGYAEGVRSVREGSVSCRWCFGEAARKRGRGRSESVRGGERYFLGHCLAGEENQRREVGIRAEEVCFLEAAQEEF